MTTRLPVLALLAALPWSGLALGQDAPPTTKPDAAAPAQDANKDKPAEKDKDKDKDKDKEKVDANRARSDTALFGAGCFWSTEAYFERLPGVKSVTSGFAGGVVPNPSYAMVCTGETGHAESVLVEFDPTVITYEKLVRAFFAEHDPTTLNSQGDDFGTQYRSVIFFKDDEQRETAKKVYKDLTDHHAFRHPIVTQLVPATNFFPAEYYHQDYYRKNPYSEYSEMYIIPKLRKHKLLK